MFHALEASAGCKSLVISAGDTFAAKESLQGLVFWGHTTLQPQGEHTAITQRSHLCFLVLVPSFKKDFDGIEKKGKKHPKNLTFGCLPLDGQPKRGTAAVPCWHLTITEPKHMAKQITMGDGSQEEPPNSLVSAGVKQRMAPVIF